MNHFCSPTMLCVCPSNPCTAPLQVLYILMNGTGVGFSVEPIFVEQLPTVAERFVQTSSTVMVEDSREGWARALREIIALLYTGHVSFTLIFLATAQISHSRPAPDPCLLGWVEWFWSWAWLDSVQDTLLGEHPWPAAASMTIMLLHCHPGSACALLNACFSTANKLTKAPPV
jgi:hypothetical protein